MCSQNRGTSLTGRPASPSNYRAVRDSARALCDMGGKKQHSAVQETWQTNITLNTPSQINKFFDRCTEWILAAPAEHDVTRVDSSRREAPVQSSTLIGITDDDAILIPERPCYICKTTTRDHMVANPFCRAYGVSLCRRCYAGSI